MQDINNPFRTGFSDFLRKTVSTQFVIPVYQRNYTWTVKRDVSQYINDLRSVIKKPDEHHFMGIIIYYETSSGMAHEYAVIDGQQRLTTIFLTMYALRDLLIKQGKSDDAKNLEGQFLLNQFCDDSIKLKLKPGVNDDDVYKKIIEQDLDSLSERDQESNVYVNFQFLKKELESIMSEEVSFDEILKALNRLYVVCIPLCDKDDAQKIFESINSTGEKLTASDLIRNFILMTIKSDSQETYYNNYWKKIEDFFGCDSKKMEAFFRFFLASKNYKLCNIRDTYSEFKNWYNAQLTQKPIELVLSEAKEYAKSFFNIKYSTCIGGTLQSALDEFRRNNTDVPTPFLMEMYRLYSDQKISNKQLETIIRVISTYWIRRELLGLDTKPLSRLFPSLIKTIEKECNGDYKDIDNIFIKHLIVFNRGKAAAMPDDEQFSACLSNEDMYIKRDCLRIILERLELKDNAAPVDLSKLNVEHLMPQDGTKWYSKLGCTEVEYLSNLHRLGNLTLVSASDNSKAKNNIWEKKKELFATTNHLNLNIEIISKPDWNLEEIEKRTTQLVKEILKCYPYYSVTLDDKHEINISISDKSNTILAVLNLNTGAVVVLKDSVMAKYSGKKSDEFVDVYQNLIDEGVLSENNNDAIFEQDYTFEPIEGNKTGLSTAASFIYRSPRTGMLDWKDDNGDNISQNAYYMQFFGN